MTGKRNGKMDNSVSRRELLDLMTGRVAVFVTVAILVTVVPFGVLWAISNDPPVEQWLPVRHWAVALIGMLVLVFAAVVSIWVLMRGLLRRRNLGFLTRSVNESSQVTVSHLSQSVFALVIFIALERLLVGIFESILPEDLNISWFLDGVDLLTIAGAMVFLAVDWLRLILTYARDTVTRVNEYDE
jgi:hypothetical protein